MSLKNLSYSINVNYNNQKYECKKFADVLDDSINKFISNANIEINKFKQTKTQVKNKVYYIPEKVLNSAYLTLFEGPKSFGKTTFMESFCKYIVSGEIKLKYINKISMINLLNYLPSSKDSNFVNLFINGLLEVFEKNSNSKKSLLKYLNSNSSLDKSIDIDQINKINKEVSKPILYIIDNIEKLGSNVDLVLGVINKLSVIKNFAFIFIVDGELDDLTNSDHYKKYLLSLSYPHKQLNNLVNATTYAFRQDYTWVLNRYGFDDEYVDKLNKIIQSSAIPFNLKSLNNYLTSLLGQNNSINKYKLLSVAQNISNICGHDDRWVRYEIDENITPFINKVNELFNNKGNVKEITRYFLSRHHDLNYDNYDSYWNESNQKQELEFEFRSIFQNFDSNPIQSNVNKELKILEEHIDFIIKLFQGDNEGIYKKINNKRLIKTTIKDTTTEDLDTFIEINISNVEKLKIGNAVSLSDKSIVTNQEELDSYKIELAKNNRILEVIEKIKNEIEEYFKSIDSTLKQVIETKNSILSNNNYAEDISILNEFLEYIKQLNPILNDIKSLEDIAKNDNYSKNSLLNELINDELVTFIRDKYLNLN